MGAKLSDIFQSFQNPPDSKSQSDCQNTANLSAVFCNSSVKWQLQSSRCGRYSSCCQHIQVSQRHWYRRRALLGPVRYDRTARNNGRSQHDSAGPHRHHTLQSKSSRRSQATAAIQTLLSFPFLYLSQNIGSVSI